MIIIQLGGGLGNQMFQYALGLQLRQLGREVRIDDTAKYAGAEKRSPALGVFGIDYERPTRQELIRMLDSSMLPWNRVRRKLFGRKKKSYFEEDKRYHGEIMTWDDIYLEGYWQSDKYFASVADQVREAYDTDKLIRYLEDNGLAGNMETWLARIADSESVSVHIRRGDYLLPEARELFGGICTETYYREAMRQIRQQYPNCRFYLFTNDKAWISERLAQARHRQPAEADAAQCVQIVDLSGSQDSDYAEFVLMSRCRHNILANSSFSWWASYLNRNEDKIVIAPDRWLNGWDCSDMYRTDMRKVKG